MLSFSAHLHSYFDISLVIIGIAFWSLLIYSTLRILSKCLTYGRQRGIVNVLIPVYWITLFINALMISLIIFEEIKIHLGFLQNDNITNIVRFFGSYIVLYFNFLIDCLMLSCWFILFANLFGFKCMKTKSKFIYALLLLSIIYFIMVTAACILVEIAHITLLNSTLLLIHFIPLAFNIIVSLVCICRLPIAQPLDLSIGLYQRNTKCSCYTPITRSIWSIFIIAIAQIAYLYILYINLWDMHHNENEKYFNIIITKDVGLLIYFISQFIVLIWFWIFVHISIKESFYFYTVLDAIKYVSKVNNTKSEFKQKNGSSLPILKESVEIIPHNENHMIAVPQQSVEPVPQPPHANIDDVIMEQLEQDTEDNVAESGGNNYHKIAHSSNENSKNENSDDQKENSENKVDNSSNNNSNENMNNDSKVNDNDSVKEVEMEKITKETPYGESINEETMTRYGESINDENAPSPPLPPIPIQLNIDDSHHDTPYGNNDDEVDTETVDDESSEKEETENTEIRHDPYHSEGNDTDVSSESDVSNPNIILKF